MTRRSTRLKNPGVRERIEVRVEERVSSLKEEGEFWGNWARGIANWGFLIPPQFHNKNVVKARKLYIYTLPLYIPYHYIIDHQIDFS